ncbi:3-oxoacyl-[acyl-carrier-protein] synthase 1 [Cedecea neteri]|uniref:3-oxoacyl-[acyl-carrier-protein] synthase 1 n=1 Tax=Cedecea neteri TaxID=158822 RepID=A0A2X3KTZ9_9ENTR|nr:3-oxoacyl-[acyl-carrier-protein] synthase 1 [Cedecea neteri]
MKRAVITGLGIVSSIGNNQQEVLASLREGRSGITFSEEFKDAECAATSGERQAGYHRFDRP